MDKKHHNCLKLLQRMRCIDVVEATTVSLCVVLFPGNMEGLLPSPLAFRQGFTASSHQGAASQSNVSGARYCTVGVNSPRPSFPKALNW